MRNIAKLNPTNKVFGYIVYVLMALAFTCAVFIGCGTDEITGGNGNPPANNDSLAFRVDSVSVWSHNPTVKHFQLIDTVSKKNTFRLKMNFISNADTCCGNDSNFVAFISSVYPFANGWYAFNRAYLQANPIDLDITFTVNSFVDFKHDLYFGFSHSSPVYPPRYIKLNKFELYIVR